MVVPNAETIITEQLRLGRVVPVVGAGFAAATARLPAWPQLIASGFDYVDAKKTWPPDVVAEARANFRTSDPASLIAGARRVKDLLGAPAGEFPAWLHHMLTVSRESCELQLLNAVADLDVPVVATTNYDKLLSMFHPTPTPVTWRDPSAMAGLFAGTEPRVFHVHGIYDRADTVIFGDDDYGRLVNDPAYRAVLQTLWLDRTLLFIGCSLDGLQDPDFIRFLEWTTITFPGLTHEHYALARANDVSYELRRHLLHDHRVLVVEYGAQYGDLPHWLSRINPNRAKALESRRARALELLGRDDAVAFGATFSGLAPGGSATSVATFADLARPLFDSHAKTLMRERNELVALQTLTRQLVSEEALRAALEAYRSKTLNENWDLFYNTALAAGEVLFVFERRVLARLWRLNAGVHTYSATGELGAELSYAQRLPDSAKHDRYTQENLARILSSVLSVLDADPEKLFPEPRPSRRVEVDADALVIVHAAGLELRDLHEPATVIGDLVETPPDVLGADVTTLHGRPTLVAYNHERITAWDPYLADAPIAQFRLDALPLDEQDLVGIFDVAHRQTSSGLLSSVVIGKSVHWLRDLEWTGSTQTTDNRLGEQIWLADDALFAVSDGTRIVRIDHDGARAVLTGARLLAMLQTLPQPLPADVVLDNMRLRFLTHEGRSILGVRARVRNGMFGSAIALLDMSGEQASLVGAWVTPQRVAADVACVTDADGSTLLFASALRKYSNDETENLAHRARGVQTSRGLIFVEDASGVPASSDLYRIAPMSATSGYAADTSGNIFAFDLAAHTSRIVATVPRAKGLLRFPRPTATT